jgi:hypothetical protein
MEPQTVFSSESGRTYQLAELIGRGGNLRLKLRDTAA